MIVRATCIVLAALLMASATGGEGEPKAVPKLHRDGPALQRATVETVDALLRDDAEGALAALDRLEKACRRIRPEEEEWYGDSAENLDRAMHRVVQTSRLYTSEGNLDRAFDEFVWVQRTCRQCHAVSRERGLLPASGPLWEVPVTSSNRVETTQKAPEAP